MRLVEHDGTQDRRLQLRRHAVRDRGPLLARQRAARRGRVRPGRLHGRVPPPRLPLRPDHRQAEDAPRFPAGANVPGSRSRTTPSPWRSTDMATPEVLAEKRELAGINADYKEKFGFHDSESGYAYKAPKGLSPRGRRNDLRLQGRAAVDAGLPAEGAGALRTAARPRNGAATSTRSTSTTSTTSSAPRRRTAATGARSRRTSKTPSTGSGSPRPSANSSPASAPSTSPRSSTTR